MNNYTLIGISGKKHSGKDEVCEYIRRLIYPMAFKRIAFADALKEEVARGTGTTVDFIEKHKENFRLILQGWGTNYRRELCSEHYWIEKWCQRILQLDIKDAFIVVPDVRFKNEYKAIKDVGGKLIRVVRPGGGGDLHLSETDLDEEEFDATILNDGSLEKLKQETKNTLDKLCILPQEQSVSIKL